MQSKSTVDLALANPEEKRPTDILKFWITRDYMSNYPFPNVQMICDNCQYIDNEASSTYTHTHTYRILGNPLYANVFKATSLSCQVTAIKMFVVTRTK